MLSGAKACKSSSSLQDFSNKYLLARFGFDTAENEPFRVKRYYSQLFFRTPPVPSVFEDSPVYRRRRRRERTYESLPRISQKLE